MKENKKYISFFSRIQAYLQKQMSAEDRYDLEKESQTDPFLHEALEGFDMFENEDILSDISAMSRKLEVNKTKKGKDFYLKIAATVVLFLGLGVVAYIVLDNDLTQPQLANTEFKKKESPDAIKGMPEMEILEEEIPVTAEESVPDEYRQDEEAILTIVEDDAVEEIEISQNDIEIVVYDEEEEAEMIFESPSIGSPSAAPQAFSISGEESSDGSGNSEQEVAEESKADLAVANYSASEFADDPVKNERMVRAKSSGMKKSASKESVSGIQVETSETNFIFDDKSEPFIPENGVEEFIKYLGDNLVNSYNNHVNVDVSFEIGEDGMPDNLSFSGNGDKQLIGLLTDLLEDGPEWKPNPSSVNTGKRVKLIVEFY